MFRKTLLFTILLVIALLAVVPVTTANAQEARIKTSGNETQFVVGPDDQDVFGVLGPDKTAYFAAGALRGEMKVLNNTSTVTAVTIPDKAGLTACVVRTLGGSTAGPITFNLPDKTRPGAIYFFIDANATSGVNLTIKAPSGVKINGGTAGKAYNCTGAAVKQACALIATDATNYEVLFEVGTWSNNNT
jgi:hypothetical protein